MIEETFITTVVERTKNPPWGIKDGKAGRANNVQVIKKNGDKFFMPKKSGYKLDKGEKIDKPEIEIPDDLIFDEFGNKNV